MEYFVTAEHPILTEAGWKSILPSATYRDSRVLYKHLKFTEENKLSIGDVLVTREATILVNSIDSRSLPESTQLYNFKLDGNNTYTANGIVVHNK